jgi:hypothetical protein
MFTRVFYQRYLLMLGLVFAFEWTLLAIEPVNRGDWALDNALVAVVVLALIAMLMTAAINRALQRDFAAEWSESLRVKIFQRLGENELKRIPKKRRR